MSHHTYACCHDGCAHVICFTPEVEQRLRRTHEWWKFPAGHSQHFSGKSDHERKVALLEDEIDELRRGLRRVLLTVRRVKVPTCWCGATFKTPKALHGHKLGADHWTLQGER